MGRMFEIQDTWRRRSFMASEPRRQSDLTSKTAQNVKIISGLAEAQRKFPMLYEAAELLRDILCDNERVQQASVLLVSAPPYSRAGSCIHLLLSISLNPDPTRPADRGNDASHKSYLIVQVRDVAAADIECRISKDMHTLTLKMGTRRSFFRAQEPPGSLIKTLLGYCAEHNLQAPRSLAACLFLTHANRADVVGQCQAHDHDAILFRDSALSDLLSILNAQAPPTSTASGSMSKLMHALIRPETTRLDFRRLKAIRNRAVPKKCEFLGERMLQLRGRGGTGKTVLLLKLAEYRFRKKAQRVLILSYNRALRTDLLRQLELLGVRPMDTGPTVDVRGVYQFFADLIRAFERKGSFSIPARDATEIQKKNWYDSGYLADLALLLRLLRGERIDLHDGTPVMAIDNVDIMYAKADYRDRLTWDFVCVDEGQDWSQVERDVLLEFFQPRSTVVAIAKDQLIRASLCNWSNGVQIYNVLGRRSILKEKTATIPLTSARRMKRDLACFANEISERLGLDWNVRPLHEQYGGRVIVLEGSYMGNASLHHGLRDGVSLANADAGDTPSIRNIDWLFCIPNDGVNLRSGASKIGEWLATLDLPSDATDVGIWEGLDDLGKTTMPGNDEFRIIRYESTRGLEGWITVLLDFDVFLNDQITKRCDHAKPWHDLSTEEKNDVAAWVMIPLTRAVDTLVITLRDPASWVADVLKETFDALLDNSANASLEWIAEEVRS